MTKSSFTILKLKRKMNKEQFTEKSKEIQTKIDALKCELSKVTEEYRKSLQEEFLNKGIHVGTKVRVSYTDWSNKVVTVECFYAGAVNDYGGPRHAFKQMKKDGTISSRNQYVIGRDLHVEMM